MSKPQQPETLEAKLEIKPEVKTEKSNQKLTTANYRFSNKFI